MKIPSILFCLIIFSGTMAQQEDLTQFVNPFIGTKNMGHTYPGATMPFGFIQLSPETSQTPYAIEGKYNKEVYQYCSGYQYKDSLIYGFSHTHFNGTGHSDLGDFLIMPGTGEINLDPGNAQKSGFRSKFSHEEETASPGYYQVLLEDSGVFATLTSTTRVGIHKYNFPKNVESHLVFDLISNIYNFEEKNCWSSVRIENDTLVTGFRQTTGWARNKTLFFAMSFSKPVKSYGHKKYDETPYRGFWRKFNESENFPEFAGRKIRAYFKFGSEEEILVKFAISAVSVSGAMKNLEKEASHWDFDQYVADNKAAWNRELNKIKIQTINENHSKTFYTALYHSMLGPVEYLDVDGQYRGIDYEIHKADGFTNYTIFSLWDTYRAQHPWLNLIQPQRNRDMIHSMLAHYKQSVHKMLPIWSHHSNENWCMIGYHAVSLLADAVAKGNDDFDMALALEACINTSNYSPYDGLDHYKHLGYVAEDLNSNSVSKTLEYAYDDWCIAQLCSHLNEEKLYDRYMTRSRNFENLFHRGSGFMQPRLSDGSWKASFDPLDTHGQGFIEGNSWNYSLSVPHAIDKLIKLMGGTEAFSQRLDSLFNMSLDDKYIEHTEDISRDGIIGNYVHGNEPSHHVPYLYNWCGDFWKTQERVRMIMESMYGPHEDGLCGNDDVGQMSAWYLFSSLGFYPVCPGTNWYALGSPLVKEAKIELENGKSFEIVVKNQNQGNVYVQKVFLNDKELKRSYLLHDEITGGGQLLFEMGVKPNKNLKWSKPDLK